MHFSKPHVLQTATRVLVMCQFIAQSCSPYWPLFTINSLLKTQYFRRENTNPAFRTINSSKFHISDLSQLEQKAETESFFLDKKKGVFYHQLNSYYKLQICCSFHIGRVDLDQLSVTNPNCPRRAPGQAAAEPVAFLSPSQTHHQLSHLLVPLSKVKNQNHKQCSVTSAANPTLPCPTAAFTTAKHIGCVYFF